MIPGHHRTKGGAPQLGVAPGQPGPSGTYREDPPAPGEDDDAFPSGERRQPPGLRPRT
ncbi:hypothetical protein ACFC5T_17130 [Streptomyces sp. NPDC055961]|uniref:hypothetical protein n=1 Tax=Streptomyces sp. NPDC055961 TaxID=3345666 RepID=UPI0035DF5565